MGENFEQLSDTIQDHLRQIVKTSGLPANEESLELLARGWLIAVNTPIAEHDQVHSTLVIPYHRGGPGTSIVRP